MSEQSDFEQHWLKKFSNCIKDVAGEEISKKVLKGSENHSDQSDREIIIRWSKNAIMKLKGLLDQESVIKIMTGCACQYPKEELHKIRNTYQDTKSLNLAHQILQRQFENILYNPSLNLKKEIIKDIIKKGWGSAGILKENKIVATKIPKSGLINEYYAANDPERKRQIYCHCPRVRESINKSNLRLPDIYCYCGAGFYKGIWEEILQKPVKVKIIKSVMKGDDVCRFEIKLPSTF